MHHNPLVAQGRGGDASRRKREAGVISLVSMKRASQALSQSVTQFHSKEHFCLLFSLFFIHIFYKDVFLWGFSLDLIVKPYQRNLQVDLAQASPTGPLCPKNSINITVNQEIGVKHTHSENTLRLITWHRKAPKPHFLTRRMSLTLPCHFLQKEDGGSFPKTLKLIPKHIQVYSRQTGPNGS